MIFLRLLLARIYYLWGSLHRNFGNENGFRPEHEAAVRRFNRAIALDPNMREARLDRGILYWREMGQIENALADFNALLVEDPAYGPALLNRGMVAYEVGRYGDALADMEAYLQLPKEDGEYWLIAERTAGLLRELVVGEETGQEVAGTLGGDALG
jgi:tetratricopeptide (TPR) repeat protein